MASLTFQIAKLTPILGIKTKEAIETALEKDQGNLYRRFLKQTLPQAEDAYRESKDGFRTHLGASQVGRECNRELWYAFRWIVARDDREEWHKGDHDDPCLKCRAIKTRMIRLLNRGHLEEARIIALLLMIGCEVYTHDSNGKQFTVSMHNGHFGGSCDSVAVGIPDLPPGAPALAEMKTHNDTSFSKLLNEGLRGSKPEHYAQMQIYMGGLKLLWGVYIAVNKDNDDLYIEIVEFNPEFFDTNVEKGRRVILAVLPPPRISENPAWWKCKFCDARSLCHRVPGAPEPLINCRSCRYSTIEGPAWRCTFHRKTLTKQDQIAGCPSYQVLPEV